MAACSINNTKIQEHNNKFCQDVRFRMIDTVFQITNNVIDMQI